MKFILTVETPEPLGTAENFMGLLDMAVEEVEDRITRTFVQPTTIESECPYEGPRHKKFTAKVKMEIYE